MVRERARLVDTLIGVAATLLAAACVIPLFVDLSWVTPALVIVIAVAAVGAGARAVGMPLPLIPITEALALLASITALYAGRWAWGGVIPTSEAWDVILARVSQGMADTLEFSAPVPPLPGMVLLAVGGIGVVMLSVDTLFVSVRSPILAGLPLAALYLVPALINAAGPPWWTLPLAGAAWLLILAADQRERVRSWGGLDPDQRIRGLSAAGRRVGALALVAAAAIAVLLPAGAWAPWRTDAGEGPGVAAGPADAEAVILDPLVSMRRNLVQSNNTEVLTYRTQATQPSYLRIAALESFDGQTWSPREGLTTRRDPGTPLPGNVLSDLVALDANNRVTGGDSFTYEIEVGGLQNSYLPLPYPISEVDDVSGLDADWRIDLGTGVAFSDGVPASGLSYRVKALDPRVEADTLRAAAAPTGGLWPQLALPSGLPPIIGETALEVTASAESPYERALALQRWFTREGDFTYSTGVPSGADGDYLANFLDERVGYCEQFAGAMAVMARTLGIPSRVVVGFTQGSPTDDGQWRVTVRDAHAWPELWFDTVGWVRFEPTPRAQGTVQSPDYAPASDQALENAADATRGVPAEDETVFPEGLVDQQARSPLATAAIVVLAVGGVLLLGWFVAPMVTRALRRHRRLHADSHAAIVEGAWSELGDIALDLGRPWSVTSTPSQNAARLGRGLSAGGREALDRIRRELEQVRYGRPTRPTTAPAAGGGHREHTEAVRSDLAVVVRELRDRVRWQTRVRAYCWPSSERRRQRSSMRFMKPDFDDRSGAGAGASAAGSAAPRVKAE